MLLAPAGDGVNAGDASVVPTAVPRGRGTRRMAPVITTMAGRTNHARSLFKRFRSLPVMPVRLLLGMGCVPVILALAACVG